MWDVIRGSIYDQDWRASGLSYHNKLYCKKSILSSFALLFYVYYFYMLDNFYYFSENIFFSFYKYLFCIYMYCRIWIQNTRYRQILLYQAIRTQNTYVSTSIQDCVADLMGWVLFYQKPNGGRLNWAKTYIVNCCAAYSLAAYNTCKN